jgi:hypothetical protein
VAEDRPVAVEERHAHVADGARPAQFRITRIELEDAVRNVHEASALHDLLARRAVDVAFPVDEALAQPEGERAQPSPGRVVLRHPRSVCAERLGEDPHQRLEESLTRLARGALEQETQRGVLVERGPPALVLPGPSLHHSAARGGT